MDPRLRKSALKKTAKKRIDSLVKTIKRDLREIQVTAKQFAIEEAREQAASWNKSLRRIEKKLDKRLPKVKKNVKGDTGRTRRSPGSNKAS